MRLLRQKFESQGWIIPLVNMVGKEEQSYAEHLEKYLYILSFRRRE